MKAGQNVLDAQSREAEDGWRVAQVPFWDKAVEVGWPPREAARQRAAASERKGRGVAGCMLAQDVARHLQHICGLGTAQVRAWAPPPRQTFVDEVVQRHVVADMASETHRANHWNSPSWTVQHAWPRQNLVNVRPHVVSFLHKVSRNHDCSHWSLHRSHMVSSEFSQPRSSYVNRAAAVREKNT